MPYQQNNVCDKAAAIIQYTCDKLPFGDKSEFGKQITNALQLLNSGLKCRAHGHARTKHFGICP